MSLFNDWSVHGDGMALAEYQAIGSIDSNLSNPITIFSEN